MAVIFVFIPIQHALADNMISLFSDVSSRYISHFGIKHQINYCLKGLVLGKTLLSIKLVLHLRTV